jgi:hypothetical protein
LEIWLTPDASFHCRPDHFDGGVLGRFYGMEDWRGIHAWSNYRRAAEKRGLALDLKGYIPKDVPG